MNKIIPPSKLNLRDPHLFWVVVINGWARVFRSSVRMEAEREASRWRKKHRKVRILPEWDFTQ